MGGAATLSRTALGIALVLVVASCAQAPRPAPAPPLPPPVIVLPPPADSTTPPVVSGAWDELPVIEGKWSYDAARRTARFVDDSGLERVSLTCSAPGRTMRLSLPGERGNAALLLSSAGRSAMTLSGGVVELDAADVALDRMAFSRGRFGLQASQLLVLPVQSEIGRVIEDCRG